MSHFGHGHCAETLTSKWPNRDSKSSSPITCIFGSPTHFGPISKPICFYKIIGPRDWLVKEKLLITANYCQRKCVLWARDPWTVLNFETKNIFDQKNQKLILDLDFGFSVHLLNRIQIFNSRKNQFSTSKSATSGPIKIQPELISSLLDNSLSSFEELTGKMVSQKSSLNSQVANQVSVLVKLLWETGQLFNQSDLTSPEQIRIDHSITEFIGHFRDRRHFKAAFVRYFPEFMQMVFGINSRS